MSDRQKNWLVAVGLSLFVLTAAVTTTLVLDRPAAGPAPGAVAVDEDAPPPGVTFGWEDRPDDVKVVQDALPIKSFSETPAGKADGAPPDSVYLWKFYLPLLGRGPPAKNQLSVGSCVGFGTTNAVERSLVAQIVSKKQNFGFKFFCEEVTYGGSRVEVGGGKIRGDGSVGAWAAKWVHEWGMVSREQHGSFDLTAYDVARCRKFGSSGVPKELEDLARQHPVKDVAPVRTTEELEAALANGYAVAVCSNQGFSMTRDANGVSAAKGNWGHCMCCDGYHKEAGQTYFHFENSWGPDAMRGPTGWGEPSTAGFWAKASVVASMLRMNDSFAFSGVKGFPAQKLDWFVQAGPSRVAPARRFRDTASILFTLAP